MNSSSSYKKGSQVNNSDLNHRAKVGSLYDRLLLAEGHRLADKNLTIHKRLHFPQEPKFEGILDINDWLKTNISFVDHAHILDAGCGVGGTLFSLIEKDRTGVGVTLSQR